MIKTVSQPISPYIFSEYHLDLTVTKPESNIRTIGKKLGKHNKITMQLLATYRKKYFRIGQKFLFLVTQKESKNKKLPSKWTPFVSLVFSLMHSISTCPIFANHLL